MPGPFSAIDLSTLPAPDVVETLDYEAILAEMLADLQARDSNFTALVESDPAFKILEVAAYRELLIRQRVNDAGRAVMLAYATGADLDNLGALYSLTRQVLDEGDPDAQPPVDPTYESDADFRRRIQLSVEGFSTAGPVGAYLFHGLSVTGVKDVAVTSPNPGEVLVSVLSSIGDGTPDAGLLSAVEGALNDEDVRPLTDQVTVQAPTVTNYAIEAELTTYAGPDPAVVIAAAQAAIDKLVANLHRLGFDVSLSAIYAALHQPGVQHVNLISPGADLVISAHEVAYCTGITLSHVGTDE